MSRRVPKQGRDLDAPCNTHQGMYLEGWMVDQMRAEAARLDLSISALVQEAWKIARAQMQAAPVVGVPMGLDWSRASLYFPDGMIAQMEAEAERLDRPVSWVAAQAWAIARAEIMHTLLPDDGEDDPNP